MEMKDIPRSSHKLFALGEGDDDSSCPRHLNVTDPLTSLSGTGPDLGGGRGGCAAMSLESAAAGGDLCACLYLTTKTLHQ